ncbi:hypothetical protein AB1Y20_006619 [Prymnesium parvum]|uniref:Uncharacterized protein n=1 Tax=Prymnesium parvum TaxID=97485 RepID=A0AB34J0V3_PRYPA
MRSLACPLGFCCADAGDVALVDERTAGPIEQRSQPLVLGESGAAASCSDVPPPPPAVNVTRRVTRSFKASQRPPQPRLQDLKSVCADEDLTRTQRLKLRVAIHAVVASQVISKGPRVSAHGLYPVLSNRDEDFTQKQRHLAAAGTGDAYSASCAFPEGGLHMDLWTVRQRSKSSEMDDDDREGHVSPDAPLPDNSPSDSPQSTSSGLRDGPPQPLTVELPLASASGATMDHSCTPASSADSSGTRGIPRAFLDSIVGDWKNSVTLNIDAYLKHLGVAWAKRKIAASFKPETSWRVVNGALQSLMPSPLGDRLERFPTDASLIDSDLDGNEFLKTTAWEGGVLLTTAVKRNGPTKKPYITKRWIDGDGKLQQVNEHDGVSMQRTFVLKAPKAAR